MKRLNLNTVLAVLGGLAVFAPDVAALASVLQGWGVTWLAVPIRVLGASALLLSSLPRIIGRLRPVLAALNLATPGEPESVESIPYDVEITGPPTRVVPLDGRRKDGGYFCPCFWIAIALALAALACVAFLWPRPARADDARWTYGVTASVSAAAIDLRTADLYLGGQSVAVGPCFDVTHRASNIGGSLCLNYQRLPTTPNAYSAALFGHWRMIEVGLGIVKGTGEPVVPLLLVGGQATLWRSGP